MLSAVPRALARLYPPDRLLTERAARAAYQSDALTAFHALPAVVVLPETRDEVIETVRLCHREGLPFVARGSGTSLSGGSLPVEGGVVIALNRLHRILRLDPAERVCVVEPGVWNLEISRIAAAHGLLYAPDPSSQQICSIGGNVAFNSGGAHCLKYGMTASHILGLTAVLPDGEVVRLGGESFGAAAGRSGATARPSAPIELASLEHVGPNWTGFFVGSEGLFGIALEIAVRLVPRPERYHTVLAAYRSMETAGEAVAQLVASGLPPGAIEMMDRLAMDAAEASVHAGYPPDAAATLIVELEGPVEEVEAEIPRLEGLIEESGAFRVQVAHDEVERAAIWKGRKGAFSAVGRLSPDYIVQDGVVPRTKLGAALAEIERLSRAQGIRVANVFHAGDGNLHPLILYDGRAPGELERAEALAGEMLRLCVRLGGSITGEHGVGMEKRAYLSEMFGPDDMATMRRIRRAVDPLGLANPGKMLLPEGPGEGSPGRQAAANASASGGASVAGPGEVAHGTASASGGASARTRGEVAHETAPASAGAPGTVPGGGSTLRPTNGASTVHPTNGASTLHPTTIDELCEAVRSVPRLLPRGGGTKPACSTAPEHVATLELGSLRGIVEYNPGEFTITALAGTPLAELEATLAEHGQYLPFDPPLVDAGATVGGAVASGLSGSGRWRYGGIRDFIPQVRYVDAEGRLIRGGANVVKNVAGFDLPRLMAGSLGRLGVLAEVTFKVLPAPESRATLRVTYATLDDARAAMVRLGMAPLEPEALDLTVGEGPNDPADDAAGEPVGDRAAPTPGEQGPLDGGVAGVTSARQQKPSEPTPPTAPTLSIRFGGLAAAMDRRTERLTGEIGRSVGALGHEVLQGDRERAYWRSVREFGWVREGWALLNVPLAPSLVPALERALGGSGSVRRYCAGGNQCYLAWPSADIGGLEARLREVGVGGLLLRGRPTTPGQPLIGVAGHAFGDRVRSALDPVGRFVAL